MSEDYRQLHTTDEILRVASLTETAWQHPAIPARQYELVRYELDQFRTRKNGEPFSAFARCMEQVSPNISESRDSRLLDVGASGGYYGEVLKLTGFRGQYTGCDSSRAFADLAKCIYYNVDYDVCDARTLPYRDDWFEIVLSGGCIMHIYKWREALAELVRVSSRYIILHRTPIAPRTTYWEKTAYGVQCLEIHFGENELLSEFAMLGLTVRYSTDSSFDSGMKYGMRSYLLEKPAALNHIQS